MMTISSLGFKGHHPSFSKMLKKSASLACSFGLFGLSGLFGCMKLTRWTR